MKYTLAQPAAWIMVSQRCPHPKPRTCEYVRLYDGRSKVTDGIKLAHLLTWTYEDHSRVYWWVQHNHQGPWMWMREAESQGESNLLWGRFTYLDFFLLWRWSPGALSKGIWVPSRAQKKGKEMDFPPEPLHKGAQQLCSQFDFLPVEPILNCYPPELQDNHLGLLQGTVLAAACCSHNRKLVRAGC